MNAIRVLCLALLAATAALGCVSDTPLALAPQELPRASVGETYDVAITPVDGSGSGLTIAVTDGALPPGISTYRPPGNGTGENGLRGTPTLAGTYTFTVELAGYCTMGGCQRGSRDYTLIVDP